MEKKQRYYTYFSIEFGKMHYLLALIFSGLLSKYDSKNQFSLRISFSNIFYIYLHAKYSDIIIIKKVGLGKWILILGKYSYKFYIRNNLNVNKCST